MEGLIFCVHDKSIRHSVCMCNSSLISPTSHMVSLLSGVARNVTHDDVRCLPSGVNSFMLINL